MCVLNLYFSTIFAQVQRIEYSGKDKNFQYYNRGTPRVLIQGYDGTYFFVHVLLGSRDYGLHNALPLRAFHDAPALLSSLHAAGR